jgi:mono/diheme cytochrome c family protein
MGARIGRPLVGAMVGLFVAGCLMPAVLSAQGAAPAAAVERGRTTFQEHCAVCHGDRGKGDGPASSALRVHPVDLATLTRRNGTFPAQAIVNTLKGTEPVAAHGSPTMLMWGSYFLADANGDRAAADARIADVVAFVKSIQVK